MMKIFFLGIFVYSQCFAMLDRNVIEAKLFSEYVQAFEAQKSRVKFNQEFTPEKIKSNGFFSDMVGRVVVHCNMYKTAISKIFPRKALFMAGFPGAGKSSIKATMKSFVNIDPDEFRTQLQQYKMLRASGEKCLKAKQKNLSNASDAELEECLTPAHDQLQPAIIAMANLAVQCAAKGRIDIGVDGTMPNKALIAKLQEQNILPWVVFVEVSPEIAKGGVRGRTIKGGVFVPFSKIDVFTKLRLIEQKIDEMKRDGITPIVTVTRSGNNDFIVKEIFDPEKANYNEFIGKSISKVGPMLWDMISKRMAVREEKIRIQSGKSKKYICADPLCRNFNVELRY